MSYTINHFVQNQVDAKNIKSVQSLSKKMSVPENCSRDHSVRGPYALETSTEKRAIGYFHKSPCGSNSVYFSF